MSNKYHGLPDIDTAPDVFETGDEPDSITRPVCRPNGLPSFGQVLMIQNDMGLEDSDVVVRHHSELIDATGLPARKKVERVFGRRSGSIRPSYGLRRNPERIRRSSASSSSDNDIPKETPSARIRRLKNEMAQLERELQGTSATTFTEDQLQGHEGVDQLKSTTSIRPHTRASFVDELAGLRVRLGALDVPNSSQPGSTAPSTSISFSQRLEQLGRPPKGSPGEAEAAQGQRGDLIGRQAGLSDIDKRLAVLEDLVGQTDLGSVAPSPLLSTLNKHDHLLSLLTQPRHLDAISRRVKLLLVDLDRAATAARRQGASTASVQPMDKNVALSQADYNSLQSLFGLLPRLDPLVPIVPLLLSRLQSLAGLHAAAGEIADSLIRLQNGDKGEGAELQELTAAVEGVQHGLDDATRQVTTNWTGVETRLKDLEARLQKLNE